MADQAWIQEMADAAEAAEQRTQQDEVATQPALTPRALEVNADQPPDWLQFENGQCLESANHLHHLEQNVQTMSIEHCRVSVMSFCMS